MEREERKRYLGLQLVCIGLIFFLLCMFYGSARLWNEKKQLEDAMQKAAQRIEELENENEILQEENENLNDNIQILQDHIQELEDNNNDSIDLPTNFVELFVKDVQNDTLIVASDRKDNTLSITGYGDKNRIFERPTFLYFSNDSDCSEESEVRLYFKMDLRPVFEDGWELFGTSPSGKEVTVKPDSDNEYYYYLDLKEKGVYIMETKRDGDTFSYFALIFI